MPHKGSWFIVMGDAKSLVRLDMGGGNTAFIAGINDGKLQSFRWETPFKKVRPESNEISALVTYFDGSQQKVEFPFGNGTLAQSSNSVIITLKIKVVTFYDAFGDITRDLEFNKKSEKDLIQ
jgi:hypothetical protein